VLDYTGTNVTKENFLNVIKGFDIINNIFLIYINMYSKLGNASAVKNIGTGRVLESKAEDRVFFYMNDHGIPGVINY